VCVIRSPHAGQGLPEHLRCVSTSRLLDIVEPTSKTVGFAGKRLDLPAGVDIEIKIQQV